MTFDWGEFSGWASHYKDEWREIESRSGPGMVESRAVYVKSWNFREASYRSVISRAYQGAMMQLIPHAKAAQRSLGMATNPKFQEALRKLASGTGVRLNRGGNTPPTGEAWDSRLDDRARRAIIKWARSYPKGLPPFVFAPDLPPPKQENRYKNLQSLQKVMKHLFDRYRRADFYGNFFYQHRRAHAPTATKLRAMRGHMVEAVDLAEKAESLVNQLW